MNQEGNKSGDLYRDPSAMEPWHSIQHLTLVMGALFEEDRFVDLYSDVVKSKRVWPTTSLSLKTLASFLGFNWRDTDPSGAGSIQWFHQWVETGDDSIRRRILECNEDDCRATRVLVDALKGLAPSR